MQRFSWQEAVNRWSIWAAGERRALFLSWALPPSPCTRQALWAPASHIAPTNLTIAVPLAETPKTICRRYLKMEQCLQVLCRSIIPSTWLQRLKICKSSLKKALRRLLEREALLKLKSTLCEVTCHLSHQWATSSEWPIRRSEEWSRLTCSGKRWRSANSRRRVLLRPWTRRILLSVGRTSKTWWITARTSRARQVTRLRWTSSSSSRQLERSNWLKARAPWVF